MTNPLTAWRRASLLGALALLSLLGSSRSASAELIGVASRFTAPSAIYSIDPATGVATLLTNTPGTAPYLTGADFRQGILYASDVTWADGICVFVTYDLATGAFVQISDQAGFELDGLAYRQGNDLFYSVSNSSNFENVHELVTIDPGTGAVSNIANTLTFVRGLAFDQASDILYGVTGETATSINLVTIDPSTGAVTTIGATGQFGRRAGLAFDEDNRILYMNLGVDASTPNSLFRINTATGAATLVGGNGAVVGEGIDGVAWRPGIGAVSVPEPSSFALTGLGMLGLVAWLRRTKKPSGQAAARRTARRRGRSG